MLVHRGYLLFLLLGSFAACLSHLVLLAFIFEFRGRPYLTRWLFHCFLSIYFFSERKIARYQQGINIFGLILWQWIKGKDCNLGISIIKWKNVLWMPIQFIHKKLWEILINWSMFGIIDIVIYMTWKCRLICMIRSLG